MARKFTTLEGTLQVGEGRESRLMNATAVDAYGQHEKVDVLLSADDRHIWVRLPVAEARKLAQMLLAACES